MSHPAASIRTHFLQPESHYSLSNTATLLGLEESEVRGWIVSGELEAADIADELLIPWSELVTFALELIGQEVIEEALGTDLERAMPELVRLAELRVRIPRATRSPPSTDRRARRLQRAATSATKSDD